MIVRMKDDDKRMKLQKGDVLLVRPYPLDPSSKLTVIRRLSDDFDPGCNLYRSQVEVVDRRTDRAPRCRSCKDLSPNGCNLCNSGGL